MPYCTKCGEKIIDGNIFCIKCGEKIHIPKTATQRNATEDSFKVDNDTHISDIPVFAAPSEEISVDNPNNPTQQSGSVFMPSTVNNHGVDDTGINNSNAEEKQINSPPVFTPPSAPKFTPPAQTFTPPAQTHNGPVCYYHKDEPAVAKCARCGKFLCQDCFDSYGVSSGDYAGQALCYDCTQQLVADNVAELTKNKNKIKVQFIVSLVGIILGLIIGIVAGAEGGFGAAVGVGLIGAAVGGVFLSAMKVFFSLVWDVIKIAVSGNFGWLTVLSIIWNIIVLIFKCLFTTISNTIYYITYLKRTSGFIESDQASLRQMQDYMEYTMIRNQNRGVDIETLLKENSALADNSVAQMARTQTEEQIEATMRGCVASINENGEIIRSFHEAGRQAAA